MHIDVCIPTRNRLNNLQTTVAQWLEVSNNLRSAKIRICIADGGSTDGTQEWLKTIAQRVSLYDGSAHYGERLINFVKKSDANYIWFFGDDDLIVEDKLNDIIAFLNNNKFGICILNYSVWDKTLEKIECQNAFECSLYHSAGWPGLGQRLGFLSILIIDRNKANNLPLESMIQGTSAWPHIPLVIALASQHGAIVYKNVAVKQRGGASLFGTEKGGWYEPFVFDWYNICKKSLEYGLDRKDFNILIKAPFFEKNLGLRRIIGEKLIGHPPTMRQLLKMVGIYKFKPQFVFLVLLPALVPKCLYKFIRSLIHILRSKTTSEKSISCKARPYR